MLQRDGIEPIWFNKFRRAWKGTKRLTEIAHHLDMLVL